MKINIYKIVSIGFLIIMGLSLSAQTTCRERDSLELLKIYDQLGGENWTYDYSSISNDVPNSSTAWNVSLPISEWHGVSVNEDGCVVSLNLRENNLKGNILNFSFTGLTNLTLRDNEISGNIPDFTSLPNLKSLIISNNNLTGTIPDFSFIPNLQLFRCHNNFLSDTIPDFNNLPNLETFLCSNNNLTGSIPDFTNLPKLEIFICYLNNLSGSIPDFTKLPNLKDLSVSDNNLTGTIPHFTNLPNLEFFFCQKNNLTGTIPDFSEISAKFKTSNLAYNSFTFEDLIASFQENKLLSIFIYKPQDTIHLDTIINLEDRESLDFDLGFDEEITESTYLWYKDDIIYDTVFGNNNLSISNIQPQDAGSYHVEITNPNVPDLTLIAQGLNIVVNDNPIETDTLKFFCGSASGSPGETVCIDVSTENFNNIHSLQFSIHFDPIVMTPQCPLTNENINIPGLGPSNFNCNELNEGHIKMIWEDSGNGTTCGVSIPDGDNIFTICFDLIGDPGNISPIYVAGIQLPMEYKDIPNCSNLDSFAESTIIDVSIGTVNIECGSLAIFTGKCDSAPGQNNGSINFYSCGGLPPYSYNINGGSYTGSISEERETIIVGDLPPGTYSVTITDSNGDMISGNLISIGENQSITVDAIITQPTCYDRSNGVIEILNISGGTAPYTTLWDNFNFDNPEYRRLGNGDYGLTVTDAAGCQLEENYTVMRDTLKGFAEIIADATCPGSTDGVIQLTAAGGNPYPGNAYVFNNRPPTDTFIEENAPAGWFYFQFTDSSVPSCRSELDSIFVPTQRNEITTELTITDVSCAGLNDGKIFVLAMDSIDQFSLFDSIEIQGIRGQSSYQVDSLSAGVYYLSITSAVGCINFDTIVVSEPDPITLKEEDITITCNENESRIILAPTGGTTTSDYQFLWGSGETGNNLLIDQPGSYTVTISDDNDCSLIDEILVSASSLDDSCECRSDSLELMRIYDEMGGENWTYENNDAINAGTTWNVSLPVSQWHGVTVNENGCVISLDLSFNNVSGDIIPIVLSELKTLTFRNNQVSGQLPDFLGLPNLRILDFNNNNLNGDIPDFSNLPNLEDFSGTNNNFTGSIPDFSNLPNLVTFWCAGNNLTGNIPNFSNLPNLEHFYCHGNNLTGIIPNFSNIPNLNYFDCSGNNLIGTIPDFNNLLTLIAFYCSSNDLTGFIPDFSNLPNLETFYCHNNQLSGSIPDFTNTPKLEYFFCSGNNLTGTIPDFSNLPELREFGCPGNQISGQIPNFSNTPQLERMVLAYNELTGSIPDFTNLPNLIWAEFQGNNLTEEVPNLYDNSGRLRELVVSQNLLTFEDLVSSFDQNNTDTTYVYAPQDTIIIDTIINISVGQSLDFDLGFDENISGNIYTWYNNGVQYLTIVGNNNLSIPNIQPEDAGLYHVEITNPNVPDLTLVATGIEIQVDEDTNCRMQDSLELVKFFNETGGPNWVNTWDLSQPMDEWFGITLNEDGCVICIDMDGVADCDNDTEFIGNNLVGEIPNLNLQYLTNLYLQENSLSGDIPNFEMPQLEILHVRDNQLSGSLPSFDKLPNLVGFNCFNNSITGPIPNYNLPNLVNLIIDNNNLTGTIPDFQGLPNLHELRISSNLLEGGIPDFSNMPQLRRLRCSYNQLTGELPDFSNTPLMGIIELVFNRLTGLIPDFSNIPNLRYLTIDENNLSGNIPDFTNLPNLEGLSCDNNKLTGSIPDFSNLPKLIFLSLQGNLLSEEIPNLKDNDHNDTFHFNISSNKLTFEDLIFSFEENISLWTYTYKPQDSILLDTVINLNVGQSLDFDLGFDEDISGNIYTWYNNGVQHQTIVGNNNLSIPSIQLEDAGLYHVEITNPNVPDLTIVATGLEIQVDEDSNCRMQDSLELMKIYNQLGGDNWTYTEEKYNDLSGFITIPNKGNPWNPSIPISSWHGITLNENGCVDTIILSNNNLTGILSNISFAELKVLSFDNNKIEGSIPDFQNINQLTDLRLGNNSFTGSIPDFSNLPELKLLWCFGNELSGSIPDFSNISKLQYFYCGANNLSGTIPDFTNLPELGYLLCNNNNLSGSIPDFSNLPELFNLYCFNNMLSGEIPDFSNIRSLEAFQCGNNSLSGSIPDFTNLPNLKYLYCPYNNLSGSIPDFNNLPELIYLFVGNNDLSGTIPDFHNTPYLEEFFCGNNNLTGIIPDFSNLPEFREFGCVNNQINGQIPDFSNTPRLERMVLAYNKLTGGIPDFSNLPILNSAEFQGNLLTEEVPNLGDNSDTLFFDTRSNLFTFEDLINSFVGNISGSIFMYTPQDSIIIDTVIKINEGGTLDFDLGFDEDISDNIYSWHKDGNIYNTVIGNNNLTIENFSEEDIGIYHVEITNPNIPDLVLYAGRIIIEIDESCAFNLQNDIVPGNLDQTFALNVLDNDVVPIDATIRLLDISEDVIEGIKINLGGEVTGYIAKPFSDTLYISYEVCSVSCSDCFSATLKVYNAAIEELTLTDIISPNGDGVNELLRFNRSDLIENSELIIFNRWGDTIYSTRDYRNDWNAEGYPGGIYYYVLIVEGAIVKKTLTVVK